MYSQVTPSLMTYHVGGCYYTIKAINPGRECNANNLYTIVFISDGQPLYIAFASYLYSVM